MRIGGRGALESLAQRVQTRRVFVIAQGELRELGDQRRLGRGGGGETHDQERGDEQPSHRHPSARGIQSVKRLPPPGRLSTVTRPPWASAT